MGVAVPPAERLTADEEDFLRMAMLAAVEYLEGQGVRGARMWNRTWLPRFREALSQLERRPQGLSQAGILNGPHADSASFATSSTLKHRRGTLPGTIAAPCGARSRHAPPAE